MKLVTYETSAGVQHWGGYADGWIVDLVAADRASASTRSSSEGPLPGTVLGLLQGGPACLDRARRVMTDIENAAHGERPDFALSSSDVAWRTPIPQARMFSMRGNNPILLRLDGLPIPKHPTLTPRHPGRLIGHRQPIELRPEDGEIAWGAELVAVLGRWAKNITSSEATAAIAGYMATNDLSGSCFSTTIAPNLPREEYTYRDEHFAGKFYGTWAMPQSLGPWLLTAEEVRDPYRLTVRAVENGVPCDTVTTASMLFSFEELVAFLSRFMTLRPGDMISSGALGYHVIPGRLAYPVDSWFAIDIEAIGRLINPIVDRRQGVKP